MSAAAPQSAPSQSSVMITLESVVPTVVPTVVEDEREKPASAEMKALRAHQHQIKEWSQKVNKRLYELEEQYMEETTLGNVVRGWDQDAKPQQQKKIVVDDRERLFSNSSCSDQLPLRGRGGSTGTSITSGINNKKKK